MAADIIAGTGRMAVAHIALGLARIPGKGADTFRINGAVAMAIQIVTNLGYRVVAR